LLAVTRQDKAVDIVVTISICPNVAIARGPPFDAGLVAGKLGVGRMSLRVLMLLVFRVMMNYNPNL